MVLQDLSILHNFFKVHDKLNQNVSIHAFADVVANIYPRFIDLFFVYIFFKSLLEHKNKPFYSMAVNLCNNKTKELRLVE